MDVSTFVALHEPFLAWCIDESIANGANLSSPALDTHRGQGPVSAPATSGTLYRGVMQGARFSLALHLDTAAAHTVAILGGLTSALGITVETFSPGATADDFIVRDIAWPWIGIRINNTSAGTRTFKGCFRIMTDARGV